MVMTTTAMSMTSTLKNHIKLLENCNSQIHNSIEIKIERNRIFIPIRKRMGKKVTITRITNLYKKSRKRVLILTNHTR